MKDLTATARRLFLPHISAFDSRDVTFSMKFWLLIVATGIGAGLGADLLMALLTVVQHASFGYTHGYYQTAVGHASPGRRVGVLIAAGLLATGVVWLLRKLSSGANSGIVHAIWFESGHVNFWHTIAEALLSITIVGMGASLGREGAPKQIGLAIASALAGWARLTPAETRFLAACGAGAGMGAIYNVPLGGALFALEVLLGTMSLPLILPAMVTSLIATAVSWLTISPQPTYTIPHYSFHMAELVWTLGFGPLAGIVSVLLVRLFMLADAHIPQSGWAIWAPLPIFTILGFLAIPLPQLLGNGKDITEFTLDNQIPLLLMMAIFVFKPLVTAACLGSGAPGGLFTPSLTIGAVLGGTMGDLWSVLWPGTPTGSYAVIGAGAVLAATMQTPITAIVLLLELTQNTLSLIVPIMMATATAVITARLLDHRTIYTGPASIDPFLQKIPTRTLLTTFNDLITPSSHVMPTSTPYSELMLRVNQEKSPSSIYIVDKAGRLTGIIHAEDLRNVGLLTRCVDIAAATDIQHPVAALRSNQNREEIVALLNQTSFSERPVVDSASMEYLGVVRKKAGT